MLSTFQRHLPLVGQPDLVAQVDYFYERTAGCVGVLKELLNRALAVALDSEKQIITQTILEHQGLSTNKLIHMAQEIRDGEARFMNNGDPKELRSLLGLSTGSVEQPERGSRGTVGQRNPVRDPVGIGQQND